MTRIVTVTNLSTSEERTYTLPPERAVIAAYAQARGDWNTWTYADKYQHIVTHGKRTVSCGDWTAITK